MSKILGPSTALSKRNLIIAGLVVSIAVAFLFFRPENNEHSIPDALIDEVNNSPNKITPISLTDHYKDKFELGKFRGKWTLIVFGYTNCPDVCPTTLLEIDDLALLLKDDSKPTDIQYLFVSIDPKRDTPAELAAYLAYFDAGYVGLTGSEAELKAFTDQVGIQFSYTNLPNGNYAVNHSSHMVLIDPWGRYLAHFPAPQYSADIRDWFNAIKKLSL